MLHLLRNSYRTRERAITFVNSFCGREAPETGVYKNYSTLSSYRIYSRRDRCYQMFGSDSRVLTSLDTYGAYKYLFHTAYFNQTFTGVGFKGFLHYL